MRPMYIILKIFIIYPLHLFFKGKKIVNPQNKFNAQTIFVANHSSAFMDPWVIAEFQKPILFFMTRGDIFKTWLKPITWATHMIPIFRTKENGADSANKNELIFQEVYRLLKRKKSIIIFGEGYTDNVFIRSLKPIKKGPARIGLGAMAATNWQHDIKIQCVGINYADPNEFRSEVLLSNSETIHLKNYKEEYEANPSKVINDLTKKIAELLQQQLTYLENSNLTPLHNQIQSITEKGIAHRAYDKNIPLIKRWRYSQNLASYLNTYYNENDDKWKSLQEQLNDYFVLLKKNNFEDQWIVKYDNSNKMNSLKDYLILFFGFPVFILGAIHHILPYLLLKRFIEKTFKRRVFWSSIKMVLGYIALALFNIGLLFSLNAFFEITANWIVWTYLIAVVPTLGLLSYEYNRILKNVRVKSKIDKNLLKELSLKRKKVKLLVDELVRV